MYQIFHINKSKKGFLFWKFWNQMQSAEFKQIHGFRYFIWVSYNLRNVDTYLISIVIYSHNFLLHPASFIFQKFLYQWNRWIYLRFIATKLTTPGHSNAKSRETSFFELGFGTFFYFFVIFLLYHIPSTKDKHLHW